MSGQLFNLKRYFGIGDEKDSSDTSAVAPPEASNPSTIAVATQSAGGNTLGGTIDPAKRQDLSLLTHFSGRLNQVITQAATEATRTKQAFIEPEHLLFGLLYDANVFKIISEMSVTSPTKIQENILQQETMGTATDTPQFSNTVKNIFAEAYTQAKSRGEEFISPEHVLYAIVSLGNSKAADILSQNNINRGSLERKLSPDQPLNKSKRGESALESYGVDITQKAKDNLLDPVVDRQKEVERTIHILSRRTKNNPVLVGEAGVGKTAIIEGLAQKIVDKQVPMDLANKRIISLDLTALIAGASHRGEFEQRLKQLIKEVQVASGEIILFIDEVHNLVGAGSGEGTMDAGNILKPFLARGEIQLIGTSTIDEYRRYIEKDPALERRFQQVLIEEPSLELAILMLKGIAPKYEAFHKVQISQEAIEAAVKLSKQYIGDRFLPDKAVDLIDEASSKLRLNPEKQAQVVTKEHIEEIVASWTGIPVAKLTETESQRLLALEDLIHVRLIDQEGAVKAIAEAVRRGRAGLKNTNRPVGSFLFMGPTGVGKTELAKTLAQVLFGSEILMIRLDMSEYMEKHEVAKLIGAPPGYVGYEEGGQLTEAVRTKPYSVVLLDEIEKAHPDVFNILIQILEDGRLTDNKGRTISFKNTIIIATSNIGTSLIQEEDLKNFTNQAIFATVQNQTSPSSNGTAQPTQPKSITQRLLDELQKFFKPELLNRFDEIIVFKPLTQEHMLKIATIGIANTRKLLAEQKIGLEMTEGALSQLSILGFDPIFGARPLRRTIQTKIENPISTLLIQKVFGEGDTILVDFDSVTNGFTFNKKPLPSVPSSENTQPAVNPTLPTQSPPSSEPPTVTPVIPQPPSTPLANPFTHLARQAPPL